ncbi:MAG: STAS domain-containing protein [bacterium]
MTTRKQGDVLVLALQGTVDGSDSCRAIHRTVRDGIDAGLSRFVLDLTDVDWINSLGIGYLAAAATAAVKESASVRIASPSPRVEAVLRAAGVVPHFWQPYATQEEAVASFS